MLGYFVFFLKYLLYFLFQLWFLSEIDVFFGWPYYEDWAYYCIFYLHYLFQLWFLSEINVFCGCPYYVDWMYGWSEIGRPACNGGAAGGGIAPNKPTLCNLGTLQFTLIHRSRRRSNKKLAGTLGYTLVHSCSLFSTLIHLGTLLVWYTF